MKISIKGKLIIKMIFVIVILAFAAAGFSSGLNNARIMPTGKVVMFQGNKKVGEFSKEAPLPEDTLLACQGNCGVKMDNLHLVALDGSLFSVADITDGRQLNIEKGTIYFALSTLPKTILFKTPHGIFTTEKIILNVSTDTRLVKGYIAVTKKETQIGVIEGGSMLVTSAEGERLIKPGSMVRLVQSEIGAGGAATGAGLSPLAWVPPAILGGELALGNIVENDDEQEGSPFSP